MEEVIYSETSINFYHITQRHIQANSIHVFNHPVYLLILSYLKGGFSEGIGASKLCQQISVAVVTFVG
jgi:hypothetical protein